MSKETAFFIYLLEHYASYKGVPAGQILEQWNKLGLTGFFYDMYEMYHSEALENAFADIDERTAAASRKIAIR